jgi:hypothetical protein
MKAHC